MIIGDDKVNTLVGIDLCRFHKPHSLVYDALFDLDIDDIIDRDIDEYKGTTNNCREFLVPDIHFMHFTFQGPHLENVTLKSSEPYISMIFSIKNRSIHTNLERQTIFADIDSNQHALLYVSNQDINLQWQSEENAEIFVINLTVEYFRRFLTKGHPLFSFFESSEYENTPAILGEQSLQVSARMFTILYELVNCEYKDLYKKLFIKSKVIELLMLQFEQYEKALESENTVVYENVHLEKMHKAREIIASNLAKPCSILDLAQQVGTNDCYLKKQFKQVFGTTVYGYLQQERMEKSRELLLEGNRKISEIAKLTGYKHASHFTTAFKKYFGYLPNQIRLILLSWTASSEFVAFSETALVACPG